MFLLTVDRAEGEHSAQIDLIGAAVIVDRAASIDRHQPRVARHGGRGEAIDADHAVAVDEGFERHGHAVVLDERHHYAPARPVAHMAKIRDIDMQRKIAMSNPL